MSGVLNVLLPLRILLKARKLNFHPSCCTVEIFQGIRIERVGCVKKAEQKRGRKVILCLLQVLQISRSCLKWIWQMNNKLHF